MTHWLHCFRPTVRQCITVGACGRSKTTHLMARKQKNKEGPESHKPPGRQAPSDPKTSC